MANVGIIGMGERASWIAKLLLQYEQGVQIQAITDVDPQRAKLKAEARGLDTQNVKFYTDADQMLDSEQLDGIIIGTRCSLHTTMAVKVLKRNLALFLEKPVSTSMADWQRLEQARTLSKSEVVVSFPLRVSAMVTMAKEIVQSDKLGTVEHVQAVNNVPYGYDYYHTWYRDEEETGGLFLQKATHDFDYINHLLDIRPVQICAMKSKQIFKGNHPEGLCCVNCDEFHTCPEGPYVKKHFRGEALVENSLCCFGVDTGNEDSGSAIIQYETGMHVSYSQNFFARKKAAARGARLLGYKGTLEFDWYTNQLKVFMHHTSRVEKYEISTEDGHGGGDEVLALNFIHVMKGTETSVAPLEAGLLSALMCLGAKESAENNMFITLPGSR